MSKVPRPLFVFIAVSVFRRTLEKTESGYPLANDIFAAWREGIVTLGVVKPRLEELYHLSRDLWQRARKSTKNEHRGVAQMLCSALGMESTSFPLNSTQKDLRWTKMKKVLLLRADDYLRDQYDVETHVALVSSFGPITTPDCLGNVEFSDKKREHLCKDFLHTLYSLVDRLED